MKQGGGGKSTFCLSLPPSHLPLLYRCLPLPLSVSAPLCLKDLGLGDEVRKHTAHLVTL